MLMLLSTLLLALPVPSLAAPGDLDPSFDGDGRVLTDFGTFEGAGAVVVQPDGKVVAAGSSYSFANGNHEIDFALARYNRDGSLDKSFGLEGRVVTDFVGGMDMDIACALVLQPDGKLVAAGSRLRNFFDPLDLTRYNADGTLDTSFGVGGVVRSDSNDIASALALQPDGKLVAAGSRFSTRNGNVRTDITLERFNPNGSLDTSFGTGGLVVIDFGQDSEANALVLQADGKLVVAGTLGAIGARDFAMVRYQPDGSLDAAFGTGGLVRTEVGRSFSGARALALQADGKLVAAGDSRASGDSDFALARYVTTDEPLAVPPKCGGRPATILGTSRKDTLRGTLGPDVILGLAGNDTIRGLEGNDTICGGTGRDRLIGEHGDDKLFGDNGRDRLDDGSGRGACRTGEAARRCEGQAAASERPRRRLTSHVVSPAPISPGCGGGPFAPWLSTDIVAKGHRTGIASYEGEPPQVSLTPLAGPETRLPFPPPRESPACLPLPPVLQG